MIGSQNVTPHQKHRPHVPIKNLLQYECMVNQHNNPTWQSLKKCQPDSIGSQKKTSQHKHRPHVPIKNQRRISGQAITAPRSRAPNKGNNTDQLDTCQTDQLDTRQLQLTSESNVLTTSVQEKPHALEK